MTKDDYISICEVAHEFNLKHTQDVIIKKEAAAYITELVGVRIATAYKYLCALNAIYTSGSLQNRCWATSYKLQVEYMFRYRREIMANRAITEVTTQGGV